MDRALRKSRRKADPRTTSENLVERIRETLLFFGGEAHRRDVIANVARDIGVDVQNIPEELENAMIISFEETWRDEARRATYGFHLRFGEGSHRWGLKLAAAH
jgi:energy-converting hydrogenase A subunit M